MKSSYDLAGGGRGPSAIRTSSGSDPEPSGPAGKGASEPTIRCPRWKSVKSPRPHYSSKIYGRKRRKAGGGSEGTERHESERRYYSGFREDRRRGEHQGRMREGMEAGKEGRRGDACARKRPSAHESLMSSLLPSRRKLAGGGAEGTARPRAAGAPAGRTEAVTLGPEAPGPLQGGQKGPAPAAAAAAAPRRRGIARAHPLLRLTASRAGAK